MKAKGIRKYLFFIVLVLVVAVLIGGYFLWLNSWQDRPRPMIHEGAASIRLVDILDIDEKGNTIGTHPGLEVDQKGFPVDDATLGKVFEELSKHSFHYEYDINKYDYENYDITVVYQYDLNGRTYNRTLELKSDGSYVFENETPEESRSFLLPEKIHYTGVVDDSAALYKALSAILGL